MRQQISANKIERALIIGADHVSNAYVLVILVILVILVVMQPMVETMTARSSFANCGSVCRVLLIGAPTKIAAQEMEWAVATQPYIAKLNHLSKHFNCCKIYLKYWQIFFQYNHSKTQPAW